MYKSKEIRWFGEEEQPHLIAWFGKQGLSFETTTPRIDHYLILPFRQISIKLREGNIEVKTRIANPDFAKLESTASGVFELYEKWSFRLSESDFLSREIIAHGTEQWLATEKRRMGLKVSMDASGQQRIIPIGDQIPFGCQLEYTELKVKGRTTYTFALEWFGDRFIDLDPAILSALFGGHEFRLEDSMGYGEYLMKVNGFVP
jgi:hypothetical protein